MNDWRRARATLHRPLRVALVPCAGRGERAGGDRPKQYVPVAGKTVVHWTLEAFKSLLDEGSLDGIVVVLSPGDDGFEQAIPAEWRASVVPVFEGGATRAHSVLSGLQALARAGLQEDDWVLVHDAARCLIEPHAIDRLIQACESDPIGGLLAQPVPDTMKKSDASGRVQTTVQRDHLWAAQTPQMFRLGLLARRLGDALAAGIPITDEASAIEWGGGAPRLVTGSADNFKVTYEEDFVRAARLLAARCINQDQTR